MRNLPKYITLILIWISLAFFSCRKDPEFVNPYDEVTVLTNDNYINNDFQPTDFAYLHKKIFAPTCANVGCHDGTFFPDFRTISSSYNTMVYQPVINNYPTQPRDYRVAPSNSQESMLVVRLEEFVPNTSGIMPLQTDPDSDWDQNKDTYIQNIKDWIDQGAKDIFGNSPQQGNANPEVVGVQAFPFGNTTTPYDRTVGAGMQPIEVPNGMIDLWFAATDNTTPTSNISYNKIKMDSLLTNFDLINEQSLSVEPGFTFSGFGGGNVTYNRKISADLSGYPVGTSVFLRVYLQDSDHISPVEIPNNGSSNVQVIYFSLITI